MMGPGDNCDECLSDFSGNYVDYYRNDCTCNDSPINLVV